jgi:hypothetical protein
MKCYNCTNGRIRITKISGESYLTRCPLCHGTTKLSILRGTDWMKLGVYLLFISASWVPIVLIVLIVISIIQGGN